MWTRSSEFNGRAVSAGDGDVGKVTDLYFDDEQWTVRYLVVETGHWLASRKVLISPASLTAEQPDAGSVRTHLSRQQIEDSPPVDTHKPVSRQYEATHAAHYGYPLYWAGPGLWGPGALPLPAEIAPARPEPGRGEAEAARRETGEDSHLRSAHEVKGYHLQALDGEIGHVDDFLVDPKSWRIARIVVDTRNWLPGRRVQIEPSAIQRVDWADRKVHVEMTREQIKSAPEGAG